MWRQGWKLSQSTGALQLQKQYQNLSVAASVGSMDSHTARGAVNSVPTDPQSRILVIPWLERVPLQALWANARAEDRVQADSVAPLAVQVCDSRSLTV